MICCLRRCDDWMMVRSIKSSSDVGFQLKRTCSDRLFWVGRAHTQTHRKHPTLRISKTSITMKTALLLVVVAAALAGAMAACPNHCSGRGTCGSDDVCSCYSRYQGPDCSERKCKMSIAWVDGEVAAPHAYAECANRGVCDRESGECVCQDGFDGAGCQRLKCPNDCSGHGTCEYIGELGTYASSNWDATKIQGCKCDGGWEGYDCSERMCPRGDDPLTIHLDAATGDQFVISVRSDTDGSRLAGNAVWIVQDLYGTWETSRPFDVSSASEAEAALEDTDIIVEVDSLAVATYDVAAGDGYTYTIRLSNPAHVTTIALEGKACNDAGCYGKRAMTVEKDPASTNVYSKNGDGADLSLLEADVCSGRGLCDRETGICQCFEGHTGLACETQTILV